MLKFNSLIIVLFIWFASAGQADAQASLSAESMGLGGGGAAYVTGFESLFLNPANLYIQEKSYKVQISLLQGGAYFDTAVPISNSSTRFDLYRDTFLPFSSENQDRLISDNDRDLILDEFYPGERIISTFQSQSDIYWFGIKWVTDRRSYAVALRTRNSNVYELGRGYYSDDAIEINNRLEFNRSFRQQNSTLHELSFGYAESFTLLNGLAPRLSEFIIGIAPKVLLAGPYQETVFLNNYNRESTGVNWDRETEFSQTTTGIFTQQLQNSSLTDLFNPTGIGIGLDLGITYLITFGGDLSTVQRDLAPTERSLRFSFSINDLGAIYHYREQQRVSSERIEEEVTVPPSVSSTYFQGAVNEHVYFLEQFNDSPYESIDNIDEAGFNTLLPTSVNIGALFQINRLKISGDLRYGINRESFRTNTPVFYTGVEIRPLPFLPLRAGTRIAPQYPALVSFGSGIETKLFDLSASVQLKSTGLGPTTEILAASLVGLKFYIR